jgi:transcriptional regulator with XRE-family HTH domain
MFMLETDRAMSELSRKIADELKQISYRDLEARTGVSRGSLEHIAREENTDFPKLETLEKLATYWKLPMWRVIEMAGVDLGLPRSVDELGQQLMSLASRLPEIEPIVQYLLKLYPDDLRGVVAYLESVDRQRNNDEGWSDEGRHQ